MRSDHVTSDEERGSDLIYRAQDVIMSIQMLGKNIWLRSAGTGLSILNLHESLSFSS